MPKPVKGETHEEWMGRCMHAAKGEGREHEQSVAMCMSMWRQHHGEAEPKAKLFDEVAKAKHKKPHRVNVPDYFGEEDYYIDEQEYGSPETGAAYPYSGHTPGVGSYSNVRARLYDDVAKDVIGDAVIDAATRLMREGLDREQEQEAVLEREMTDVEPIENWRFQGFKPGFGASKKRAQLFDGVVAKARSFVAFLKDMTVQSGHVTTAIGNDAAQDSEEEKRRKWMELKRTFATMGMPEIPPKGLRPAPGQTEADIMHQWYSPFAVAKSDPDKQLIFGWASIVEKDGKLVVDKQGDIIEPHELENAAYDFALYSRSGSDMHDRLGTSRMVESMVFTKDKQDALGIDLGHVGWWVGFKVDCPDLWACVKRGERPEFSIGGQAIPVAYEEVDKRKDVARGRRLARIPF